jgi:hypothetical protein
MLGHALSSIIIIQNYEVEFSRAMHTNGELQLNIPSAAGASDKRHATGEMLLWVSSRCLRQQEIVGQGRNNL